MGMIRDRIDYTVQNLTIAHYEHQMAFILKHHEFCTREDMFQILIMIHGSESEEQYLDNVKRFISFTKLIAPEILELYRLEEYVGLFWVPLYRDLKYALHPYGLGDMPYERLHQRLTDARKACREYE